MKTAFLDSNILLYAISERDEDSRKQLLARTLLEISPCEFILSVQVLNEFLNIATHPRKHNLSREVADQFRGSFAKAFTVHQNTQAGYDLAREWYSPRFLSLWDSLIVSSANLAGCRTLYTEDMKDGETFGEVTIVNPFTSLNKS